MMTRNSLLPNRARRAAPAPPWWLVGLVLAACCVLMSTAPARAAGKGDYRNTAEWGRLVQLWHALLDHSTGVVYNPARARDLGRAQDGADADLKALADRKLLSPGDAEGLRRIYHERYAYVRDHCYGAPRTGRLDEKQSAEAASQWVMEMQLDLLRRMSRAGTSDPKLEEAICTNLVTECTFLRSLADLPPEPSAEPSTEAGDQAREDERARAMHVQQALRRRLALIEAYRQGKLPRNREVARLVPFLLELTTTAPAGGAVAYPTAPAA